MARVRRGVEKKATSCLAAAGVRLEEPGDRARIYTVEAHVTTSTL